MVHCDVFWCVAAKMSLILIKFRQIWRLNGSCVAKRQRLRNMVAQRFKLVSNPV